MEVQSGFVTSIASAVNDACYGGMEDVVVFVKWMDEELAFLVQFSHPLPATSDVEGRVAGAGQQRGVKRGQKGGGGQRVFF